MKTYYARYESPIGPLFPTVDDEGRVTAIGFDHEGSRDAELAPDRVQPLIAQLEEYFEGKRREFDVVLAAPGTEFQHKVWDLLMDVPYGQTCSYRDIAVKLGEPNATRAVGRANGTNPIPIIVPCHRVIGANGSLTGYGGGLEIKRKLLDLEIFGPS